MKKMFAKKENKKPSHIAHICKLHEPPKYLNLPKSAIFACAQLNMNRQQYKLELN